MLGQHMHMPRQADAIQRQCQQQQACFGKTWHHFGITLRRWLGRVNMNPEEMASRPLPMMLHSDGRQFQPAFTCIGQRDGVHFIIAQDENA